MNYLRLIHTSIGKKDLYKAGLFFSFFTFISLSLSLLFSYFFWQGMINYDWVWFHYIILFFICLICWIFAFGFLGVTAICFFGKNKNSATTLFGWEVIHFESGTWVELSAQQLNLGPEAWSWIAVDNEAQSFEVLESALWNLIALGKIKLRVRKEKYSFISTLEEEAVYVDLIEASAVNGGWENRILSDLRDRKQPTPHLLFDVIWQAFGDSQASPSLEVIRAVHVDFIKNGWGKNSGGFIPKFEWTAGDVLPKHWPQIQSYISEQTRTNPALKRTIQQVIIAALKDRVDVG